jgi:DNA-binding LytR/AlgR family response regulator
MENIKVLIVEDKILIAEGIAATLRNHSLDVIGICPTGEEALLYIETVKPDLVLMDIELGGALDGISTAKLLQDVHPVPIIYLSDFGDKKTVERAKQTLPANYLTKPFVDADLVRAVEIAFTNSNAKNNVSNKASLKKHVFLKDKELFIKLACDDILLLEADRAYCKVITVDREFVLSNSMNHIHDQLNKNDFIRIHRSHIVNLNRVTSIDGNMIGLGSRSVTMSKEYREDFLSRIKFLR